MPVPKFPDRVWETSSTTGTGNITLAGAVTGYRTFAAALSTNDPVRYVIEGITVASEYETGFGTWNGSVLVRTTVKTSSNANALVSFSAGTKNVFADAISADLTPLGNFIYVKAHFGATGDGATDDTTAINAAIAAVATKRGQILVFEPGVYLVPGGITESVHGLSVLGLGVCTQGPGAQGNDTGVVIKATTAGAWTWKKTPGASGNDFYGGRFENIAFHGDADTAGGLRVEASYVTIQHCESHGHTTGRGFNIGVNATGGDSAQVNKLLYCGSSDDYIGFDIEGGCNTLVAGCYNLKYSVGGISNTGIGIRISDPATQIIGGKFENNDIGVELLSIQTAVIGVQFEANASWDIDCARSSGTSGTRHLIVCTTSKIRVGSFQVNDMLIGGGFEYPVTDNGLQTGMFMNGAETTLKVRHMAAATPTGGYSGEIRVGNSKIWVKDGATWKSVAVA